MPRFHHRHLVGLTGFALLCPTLLLAQDKTPSAAEVEDPSAQGDVAVTIYNNDLALIQDVRTLNIAAGRNRIEFPDVSSRIRPETLSFAAAGAAISEQNFDFDLLSPGSLMQKAIGQTITLVRTNPSSGVETRERATVLSTAGGVVVRVGDHIEVLRDDGLPVRAIFDRVPPNLRARPTLSVTVQSDRAGPRPASIRYLTPGLGWTADYVALYDEAKGVIDMQGWVTLTNQTGTSFANARTVLVAGSPMVTGNAIHGNSYNQYNRQPGQSGMVKAGTEKTSRDQLGDYYLYPIAGRTTIANAQTKQVGFLDVAGVSARKVYGRTIGWMQNDNAPVNISSQIAFSTSRAGGLGDALPAGTVRFYQRDSKGTPQFIGESPIGHTPTGSDMLLTTGAAFDVFAQANVVKREAITGAEWEATARYRVVRDGVMVTQIDVDRPRTFYRTTMRYKLTNAKSQPVTVSLVQGGLDRGWWSLDYRVVSETVTGEQVDSDRRKWDVPVPANGATELTVVLESRY
ncbi:DUF4139 domain-containing protein [Sphingomonas colocasiae]|uniref:DUF4139 domain-containing protein n=1 Tax=Sphingomonas colocasiae TaxID=1848973 RepID=A0ABS7PKY7_9SPHN|nr:DUF4139 domain-containing protein [Sphingomonas colocasiae]MBY8820739.1 DUF4139 domain-containing protein [Sphingomonas colocasiae]